MPAGHCRFSNGGLSITLGSQSKTTISQSESALQHGSSVGSLAGDVLATAGGQYLQLSSELLTPQGDVQISAANVALRSAPNTTSVLNIVRQRQSGLTLSASHPVIDSLQTGVQMASLARRTDNGRYQAMALLTSGLSIYNAFTGLDKLGMPNVVDGKATGGWTLSLGLSASSSSFERLTQTSTPVGPAITTGRNLSITATGTGPDAGDITLLGARLSAGGDATLRAARDITLAAAIGTSSETSRSRSSSGTVGVSLGAQGLSLTLAANRSNGWSNGWGTTYYNSEVGAAGRLGTDSGAHTTLQGAKASGQSVAMRVGSAGAGNLSISSPQDADHFIARESSSGFNVSIPIPGASLPGWIPNAGNGSFSFGINRSGMNLLADYEAVRQQTAINAGTGGFDITVAGHTHLKGGAITTEGTAAGSRLVTQSLSHETLLNRDVVEGRSQSVAVSVSNSATVGTLAGSAVGHARISTDQRSHTASAVVGTVTQTRPDLLPQALANLRAAERAPLAARLADVQSRLNTLLASEPPKEPPPCYICDWEHPGGASVPVTPMSATQAGRAAALPADMGTALPTPPTASLRDGMAPTRPGGANVGAQTQSNGATWDAWNTQVQQLRTQQTQLQQRITAVDTKTYQTTVPLAANASALHQPLLHTFDRSKATQELKDGVAVTAAFGKAAFKAVGDEAGKRTKAKEIACKDGATSPACTAATTAAAGWEEGGTYKRILHGIVGAISGGQAGALAALTAEAAGPAIGRAIVAAGVAAGTPAYDALMLAAKTAVGSGLGGAAGAAAAFNADANNRQLHPDVQRFVVNPDRIRRYMAANPGMTYAQAEQELTRTAAVLNGSDWLRVHGSSATEAARRFLIQESAGRFLPDGSTYFTPSAQDFNDASKFLVEAVKGDIFTLSPELLRYRPSMAGGLLAGGTGLVDGALSFLQQKWTAIANAPEDVRAVWRALQKARIDPASAAAAVEAAVAKLGPEMRRAFDESQAMVTILELQGDVRGASSLATLASLSFADPTGKVFRAASFAATLGKAIDFGGALSKLDGMLGKTTPMPGLGAIARNDGLLAEGVAAQFSRELGLDVKVLQNASGHGVDLYAYDAALNRYIVIEVKSSAVGSFGPMPSDPPGRFLQARAERAAASEGFWKPENVPQGVTLAGKSIVDNFVNNTGASAPKVIGYKYEVAIPKPGQSGTPTIVVKKWGG